MILQSLNPNPTNINNNKDKNYYIFTRNFLWLIGSSNDEIITFARIYIKFGKI